MVFVPFLIVVILHVSFITSKDIQPTHLFSGFFPCLPDTNNMSTQEDAQSCDLFVYAAVQLALDRVNEKLKENNMKVDLFPIDLPSTSENGMLKVSKTINL